MAHQLLHTLSYGDAISGEALALQRCFEELGQESDIFAINVHPKYKGRAKDYRDFPKDFRGEVILHYSLGSPLNNLYAELPSTKTLIYHNLTPARYFHGVNPRIVRDIEAGTEQLLGLCQASDRVLADSSFNARELVEKGVAVQVLELPVDPVRWEESANSGIASLLQRDGSIHLLHVGRVAPNKCLEDILKVFYFLHHYVERKSRLWFVGIDIDTELYSFALRRLMHELDLARSVTFTGGLSDGEVRAFYENASAYLCMSEHEGFCLPVVEAMYFGLPVIAFAAGALPETVGTGGILIDEKRHAEVAELIGYLHREKEFRDELIRKGRDRVTLLSYDRFKKQVQEIFNLSLLRHAQAV